MMNPLKRTLKVAALVLLLLLVQGTVAASTESVQASFDTGVKAFRSGDYAQALRHFEHARRLGADTRRLHYNLGVTYYHLGRYGEAQSEFEWLARIPELAPLAHYNLGLLALKQGAADEARSRFDITASTAQDPKLKALAETQLVDLQPVSKDQRWFGFVDVGAGYDDNVALVPDTAVVAPTGNDDSFAELMGGVVGRLSGNAENDLSFKASAFWLDYLDLDEFDQTSVRGGLSYRHRIGDWQTELYGFGDLIYLDGDPFERIATLSYQGDRRISDHASLRLRARSAYIDADESFDSLTGWRNQLLGEVRKKRGSVSFQGGYEFEYNDRDDRNNGAEFSSVSPLRHRLFLKVKRDIANNTEIFLAGDYQYSRYRDPNRTVSGTLVTEKTRKDNRYKARVGIDYFLTREWIVSGEYQYTRNDSNFDDFDYNSNRYMVRLERLF